MKTIYLIAGLIVLAVGSLFISALSKERAEGTQENATTTEEGMNEAPIPDVPADELPPVPSAPTEAPDAPVSSDGAVGEAPHSSGSSGGGVSGSAPGVEPAGGISATELASHNTASSCWVVFRGSVYDVTAWLARHPGGVQAIAQYCGTRDFEAAFMGQHGTRNIERFYQETTLVGPYAG